VVTELVASNNISKLENLIASNPTICDTVRRCDNMSLLYWTIVNNGSVEIVLIVLKNTSLNTINEFFLCNTVLGRICECYYDRKEAPTIVKALLEHGADPTIADKLYNTTPFHAANARGLSEICRIFDPNWVKKSTYTSMLGFSDAGGDSRR
jgi:hypothetical protein